MIVGIVILIIFIVLGVALGLNVVIPYSYSQYVAVAILACLDSVFDAFAANKDKKFKMNIFLSGFFGNALIAMLLVYIGDKLNVDIYLAAVIVFSGRLLNNFSIIRRGFIEKLDANKKNKNQKVEIVEENIPSDEIKETGKVEAEQVKKEVKKTKEIVKKDEKVKSSKKTNEIKK